MVLVPRASSGRNDAERQTSPPTRSHFPNSWWDLGKPMPSFHMWHQGFIPCKAVFLTAGLGQLPHVPLEMKGALPHSPSTGQERLWGFFCARNCHTVCGEHPFSLFLKGRFLFYLPAAGRLSTQIYSGPGMYVCTCLGVLCWSWVGFFVVVFCFCFFFEITMLRQPATNPKFGIPDIVMRKQTFLHLK